MFAQQGALSLAEPAFTPRPGQTRMALAVAQAIETGGVLVVEEGGFVQRFGQTAPERIEQRRAAWQALAKDVGMALLAVRGGVPVEPSASAVRQQLEGAPAGASA